MDSPGPHFRLDLGLTSSNPLGFTTDPLILNQWYQLHLQRLQTVEHLGWQNYLAQVRRLITATPLHPRLEIVSDSPSLIFPPAPGGPTLVTSTPPTPWLPQLSKKESTAKSPSSSSEKSQDSRSHCKSPKIHTCQYSDCHYTTDRRSNLNRHILAMHERKLTRASHFCCGIHFENKAKQRLHAKNVHSHGYNCPLRDCNKKFQRKTLLDRHMATHDPSLRKHECGTCGYKTANKSNLNRHDEKHAK